MVLWCGRRKGDGVRAEPEIGLSLKFIRLWHLLPCWDPSDVSILMYMGKGAETTPFPPLKGFQTFRTDPEERPLAASDTPLMQQYREVKDRFPHALVLFRVGDFFELFGDDAQAAARDLGLALTRRA